VSKKSAGSVAPQTKQVAAIKTKGPRIQVRRSGVHGKGVFALRPLIEGELVVEYLGEIISWDEALDRHPP
jgi:SET domain-containing protein